MAMQILVIDDDQAIRTSLSLLLRTRGYSVVLGVDGADGYAQFLAHRPAVVISDMIMPGHEAIQTIGKIRTEDPDIPIIAMSGSARGGPASQLEKAEAAGANFYLEKPFEPQELLDILRKVANPQPDPAE